MNADPVQLVIAVCLAIYGIYAAGIAASMASPPLIVTSFLLFLVEAVLALLAAFGVGRRQAWAVPAVVLLGIIIAARWLYEGFVLGIVAYLYATFIALIALVVCLAIAAYLSGRWRVDVHVSTVGNQPSH